MIARKIGKSAKRLLLVVGLTLLLPGAAGAAGIGPAEDSFWEAPALFARLWEGLSSLWTNGGSIDPSGEVTDNGGSIDPDGATVCVRSDCGATIDPNG